MGYLLRNTRVEPILQLTCLLHKIPVFIKKGSEISLGNLEDLYAESLKIASEKPDLALLEKEEGWR